MRAGHRQRAQPTHLDVAHDRGKVGEHERNLTPEQIIDGRRLAAVSHMCHFDPCQRGEQLGSHMRRSAKAARSEIERT
jgi:hypothetical protein